MPVTPTIRKTLNKLVLMHGANLAFQKFGDEVHITVNAPDGMQWHDSQASALLEVYYTHMKGGREAAYKILCTRISSGLEPLTHE